MADLPFSMRQLDLGRAMMSPDPYDLAMRLRNIEEALLHVANAIPDRQAALRIWDALLDPSPVKREL